MKSLTALAALATLAAGAAAQTTSLDAAPKGVYALDSSHTNIEVSYNHLGFSYPTIRFDGSSGELTLAESLADSKLSITIDATSVDGGDETFNGHLNSENFFDTANHPTITFTNIAIEPTTEDAGVLTGDLTVKGVTKRVSLDAVLNQVAKNPLSDKDGIGVTATTTLTRSDFNLGAYAPAVSDEVDLTVNAEFYAK